MDSKKRTRRFYSLEFKFKVLSYYYSHGENRRNTYENFGIDKSVLRDWLKAYRIEKGCVSLQSELEKVFKMDLPQDTYDLEAMRQKIASLEQALEYERMRSRGYEKLIEIAEKEEGINILKKDGAKQ
jgi:transposase-like protein